MPSKILEITDPDFRIQTLDDAIQLIGNASYNQYEKIVLQQQHLNPTFFDLKSQFAGDILQKFSNYNMKLTIVCDIDSFSNKPLQDFIRESKTRGINTFIQS